MLYWSCRVQTVTATVCKKPPYVDRILHSTCISQKILPRLHVPVALGLGAASIQDKVASVLHQLAVESRDATHLLSKLTEYRSVTLDMGVDVKIADFHVPSNQVARLLPPWMLSTSEAREEDLDNDTEGFPGTALLVNSLGNAFLANAFTIGGVHHLISTVAKDTAASLQHFSRFYDKLKVEEQLLGHAGRRDKYVASCLVGTPHANQRKVFKRFGITLYKPRWLNVVAYCKASVLPAHVLRETFDADQYNGSSIDANEKESDGKAFSAQHLRTILDDVWYKAYKLMIIKSDSALLELDKWFDSCPCHYHLFVGKKVNRHTRRKMLIAEGVLGGHCPFVSCWGWQLAHGYLDNVFDSGLPV